MELRQIRSFLSIAETLHFGRTAELIHISQPALSLQIRALEEDIGVRLFERNRRKTTLTAAGFAFRDDAGAALSQLEQAIRRARLAASGKVGLLRIGFISTAGTEIVPNVSQTAGEIPTLISLVDAHMGITILPLSAVKHSVASVIACEIADQIPMSEIGIAVSKGSRATVIDAFRSFALKRLGPAGNSWHANQ